MIKVKKHWRQVENNILEACRNLPAGITLCSHKFGVVSDDGTIQLKNGSTSVCPLGAYLLGKPSNPSVLWANIIGVPPSWLDGFVNAVDNGKLWADMSNEWRAGYQAGKRVAKKVGLQ